MDEQRQQLTKAMLTPYFEGWAACKPSIEAKYDRKDAAVKEEMDEAIRNYEQLLKVCAQAGGHDRRTKLEPLNGEERLQFVKDKVISPFALVQLDALYTELKKKASRFTTN